MSQAKPAVPEPNPAAQRTHCDRRPVDTPTNNIFHRLCSVPVDTMPSALTPRMCGMNTGVATRRRRPAALLERLRPASSRTADQLEVRRGTPSVDPTLPRDARASPYETTSLGSWMPSLGRRVIFCGRRSLRADSVHSTCARIRRTP
jgi:hypothetical protein